MNGQGSILVIELAIPTSICRNPQINQQKSAIRRMIPITLLQRKEIT